MTSLSCRFWLGAGIAAVAGLAHAQATAKDPLAPLPEGAARAQSQTPAQPPRIAPESLRDRLTSLGRSFNGKAGISVFSLKNGWQADYNGTTLFPQQSCSKLWVAITAMDAVDKGKVSLNDRVTLGRDDLTLFHQPIRAKIGKGSHTTTLGNLLFTAITESDNTANDKLMRSVGGPQAVRDMIEAKRLGSIRFYDGERALQSKIAGLIWSQSYSIGDAFYKARNALPLRVRKAAFDRYIEDPYDGASPTAIVGALARLKRGELLSPSSTARLLSIMGNTKTGANRLKGGLRPGWSLSHKTGTGQVLGSVQAGYNDIGILTAPDGRSYAVAVMIKRTSTPLVVRMTLMNNVVRAVIDSHASQGTPYTL